VHSILHILLIASGVTYDKHFLTHE